MVGLSYSQSAMFQSNRQQVTVFANRTTHVNHGYFDFTLRGNILYLSTGASFRLGTPSQLNERHLRYYAYDIDEKRNVALHVYFDYDHNVNKLAFVFKQVMVEYTED